MSFSDEHLKKRRCLSQTSTKQETPRESHQDSSFLQSNETEMRFPGVSPVNTDEEALNSRQCSFLGNPSYFGNASMNTGGDLFSGNQSNSSLGFGSQRNPGFTMIPTPRFGNSGTNPDEEALKSLHSSFFGNTSYLGSDSITPPATMNTGADLFSGNQSNSSLDYGWNMNSQRNTGFVKSGTNNNGDETSVGMMSNTNPPSFQSESPSSSSLFQQQLDHIHQQQQQRRFISHDAFGKNQVVNPSEPIYSQTPEQFHPSQYQHRYRNNAEVCQDAFWQNQVASDMVNPYEPIYSQTPKQFHPSQYQNRYRNNAEACQDGFWQNHVASDMVNPYEPIYSQNPEQFQPFQFQNQYWNNAEYRHGPGSQILPATSQIFLTRQQLEQMHNMGTYSINSYSNHSVGVRSDSGLHGHSQSQSQGHAQISNSIGDLFNGNQSNFPPGYGWNMGNTNDIFQSYLSVGYGTNTHNNPASFQPVYTSSSLAHQQQQFQQHGVLKEPQWTKTLKMNDIVGSQLVLGQSFVQNNILEHLPQEDRRKVAEDEPGLTVKVHDDNTNTSHDLCLVVRNQVYMLRKGWYKQFVERRRLFPEDKIGLTWDSSDSTLHFSHLFSVLSLANP